MIKEIGDKYYVTILIYGTKLKIAMLGETKSQESGSIEHVGMLGYSL